MLVKVFLFMLCLAAKSTVSKITVSNPQELSMQFTGHIKSSYSMFGNIPYGFYTIGRLYYVTSNKKNYACEPLTGVKLESDPKLDRYPILMVDRGDCSFVTKTRNVQKAGGHAAIIVNTDDEDVKNIEMIDDGTGSDIRIPALLVTKTVGGIFKKFFEQYKNNPEILSSIIVSIEYFIKKTDKVTYEFFFSSSNVKMYRLLAEFQPYHEIIKDYSKFVPHYISHESSLYIDGQNDKNNHCLSNGKYCASPRYDLGIAQGRMILIEDIRQKCIYNISYKNDPKNEYDPEYYWQYMIMFLSECINNPTPRFNYECSEEVAQKIDFETEEIRKCLQESFASEKYGVDMMEKDNILLEEDFEVKQTWKLKTFPEVIVNNKTLSGAWTAENLFEAICAGLKHPPDSCNIFQPNYQSPDESSDFSITTILLIIAVIIALNILIVFVCKRYIMKRIHERIENVDINGRINNVVTSYLALRDTK